MEIKIESGKLETSKKSGKQYTNLKTSDGIWLNVWGDQTSKIGKSVHISEPQQFGNAKWATIDKSKPEPKPEIQKHGGISKQDYMNWMEEVWAKVMKLEPDLNLPDVSYVSCSEARAALINTAMIALTNNKIIIESEEPPDEEPDDDPPF